MESERLFLASQAIDLAEAKTYIELTNRLCYYGEPNLNNVTLPVDGALERAETLVNQPVVAKYKKINGKDDLGGHEVSYDPIADEIKFGTENVGTHISVEIKDDEVEINGEIKTLPCLFAKSRIWTRNKNVVSAVKRLFSEGKLTSSWELITSGYTFNEGIKTLTDYVFEANAFLGSTVQPAYPCAKGLSVASMEESQLMIAEALADDIKISKEEEVNMEELEVIVKETAEVDSENLEVDNSETNTEGAEDETQTSSLTDWDIRRKLNDACRAKIDKWAWVSFIFPTEGYCICEYDGRPTELDYLKFDYLVEEEEVTVGDPVEVKLVVSVSKINEAIAEKNEALIKANEMIQTLQSELDTLKPFKEAAEQAERERIEAETVEKRNTLSKYAQKSGFITKAEIDDESGDIHKMISELNESGIKDIILSRFMDSLNTNTASTETHVEVASVKDKPAEVSAILDSDDDIASASIIKIFLKK